MVMAKKMSLREKAKAAAKKQQQENASPYNKAFVAPKGVEPFFPKGGTENKTTLRFLPFTQKDPRGNPDFNDKGELAYKRRYWVHRDVGPDGVTIVCPKKSFKKDCPVCEQYARRSKEEDGDSDEVKALKPKEREMFAIQLKGDDKVHLLDQSTYLFGQKFIEELNDPDNEGADACVEGEMWLRCKFLSSGSGQFKKTELATITFVPCVKKPSEELLAQVPDLDSLLIEMSYEEIEALCEGASSKVDKKDVKKVSKSSKKDDEEDEDVEDEDAEDEDAEDEDADEKPAKGKTAKKPAKDADEDEDEDADEDEKPAKGKKAPAKGKSKKDDDEDEDE